LLEADLSCARSVLSCRRCKSNGVCIILNRYKNCEQVLEQKWTEELKEGAVPLKKQVIAHLRWLCKVVRDKPDQLGLCEEQKLTALVQLDDLLRLCTKEEN